MPLNHRFIGASMFLIAFILSYFSDFIQFNIEKTTMVVVYLAILQLVYLNYISNYQRNLALSLIVVIAVANLFFSKYKLKFYLNVPLALLVVITLLPVESSAVSKIGYFFTYILVAGLTYFISYFKTKEDNKLKEKLNLIIEGTNVGTWEYNIQTGKTVYNEKWAEMIGYTLEELNPDSIETWDSLVHPDDVKKSEKRFQEHLKGKTDFYKCEKRLKHKDGHWVWVLGQGKLISRTEDGSPLKVLGININISEQKEHERTIKELNKIAVEFQKLSSEDAICNKTIEAAREILDFDLCGIALVKDNKFIIKATSGEIDIDSLPLNYGVIGKAYRNNNSYLNKDIDVDPDARPVKKTYKSGIAIPIQDIGVFQAASNEKAAFNQQDLELAEILISHTKAALESVYYQKELEYKSFHDSLTGLYNRRFFEEEMNRLDTKRNLPLSIIIADLNGLKLINDSYGHDKGDKALIKTGEILNEVLRDEDIIARHGGDEFAVLLPQTDNETVVKIIKRIKNKVYEFNQKEDIPISFALGSATKNDSDQDIEEVLKAADNNMYQNKLSERQSSKNNIFQALLNTLSAKSDETKDHAIRMTELALKFGEKLNLNNSELNRLSLLATMHDIGKAAISENILIKPGNLNEEEWKIIKQHSEKGYKITSSIAELSIIAEDILFHHERWDGEGYPQGLIGDKIPYLSRVITIIDAYDVMTHKRGYSEPISKKDALAEIENCAGTQFDPDLAEKFIEMME
ncbi:diguanylate cyclase [Halanaerobiaceae bacterium Z-7014]|uniref:Diguanylate cyclase n=2 Tax=Halonatronomonas betaini TaxID=2778430 RepID=A0A931ATH3_9FIRM|nr:diguanylate cyclase [Halonatronomonas betaini]